MSILSASRIYSTEQNALDLHLSFYLGAFSQCLTEIPIHIVSNDHDYHALITELNKEKGNIVNRFNQFHPNKKDYLFS